MPTIAPATGSDLNTLSQADFQALTSAQLAAVDPASLFDLDSQHARYITYEQLAGMAPDELQRFLGGLGQNFDLSAMFYAGNIPITPEIAAALPVDLSYMIGFYARYGLQAPQWLFAASNGGTDFSGHPEYEALITAADVAVMSPDRIAQLTRFDQFQSSAWGALTPEQAASLGAVLQSSYGVPAAFANLQASALNAMSVEAFGWLSSYFLSNLSPDVLGGLDAAHVSAITQRQLDGLSQTALDLLLTPLLQPTNAQGSTGLQSLFGGGGRHFSVNLPGSVGCCPGGLSGRERALMAAQLHRNSWCGNRISRGRLDRR